MTNKNEFLEKLAALIEDYDAELTYTTDDDGIHIYINGNRFDGDEIFIGWIEGKKGAAALRSKKEVVIKSLKWPSS